MFFCDGRFHRACRLFLRRVGEAGFAEVAWVRGSEPRWRPRRATGREEEEEEERSLAGELFAGVVAEE